MRSEDGADVEEDADEEVEEEIEEDAIDRLRLKVDAEELAKIAE